MNEATQMLIENAYALAELRSFNDCGGVPVPQIGKGFVAGG